MDNQESLSLEFQSYFVQCDGLRLYMGIITDKNFMSKGDTSLKRQVAHTVWYYTVHGTTALNQFQTPLIKGTLLFLCDQYVLLNYGRHSCVARRPFT